MAAETDRGCGVLGAALLDDKLGSLLARRLRTSSKHPSERLLDYDAPLGTFSASIKLARALAYLDGLSDRVANPGRRFSADIFRAMHRAFDTPSWRYRIAVEVIAQYLDDVTAPAPVYVGSDLVAEVRALSASTEFTIKASAIVKGTNA